jgi:hypothetical protein
VVLKKWSEVGPPEPAVYTYDESKFERLEEQVAELDTEIKEYESRVKELDEVARLWKTASLAELTKKYARELGGRQVSQRMRELQVDEFDRRLTLLRFELKLARDERDAAAKAKAGLNVEGLTERRRMSDLKAKLAHMLADFDLLIIPRMTLRNVTIGDRIPMRVYRLEEAQVAALRDYLKSGKPVLACFGPVNEPTADRFEPPGQSGPDGVEDLLTQLGIRLGRQTVLFNAESKSFAERRTGLLVSGVNVEVPPVDFEWQAGAGEGLLRQEPADQEPHRIRESMRLVARAAGRDPAKEPSTDAEPEDDRPPLSRNLELRLRHPRPIYFDPDRAKQLGYDPVFMMTSPLSWNDDNPFPTRERTPRLDRTKPDDPTYGTPDARREGPFPIAVAVETSAPSAWYDDKNATPANVRVAVVGHGGLFVGQELSPTREKLLLNTLNWLLRRDDLLPREQDVQRWQYPRVQLSARDQLIWGAATQWVLPGAIAYLGIIVLLVRRMR